MDESFFFKAPPKNSNKKTCSYSMPKERIIPNPDYALIGYPDSFFILRPPSHDYAVALALVQNTVEVAVRFFLFPTTILPLIALLFNIKDHLLIIKK